MGKIFLLCLLLTIILSCKKKFDIAILGDSISTENGSAKLNGDSTYIGMLRKDNEVFVSAVAGSSIVYGGQEDTVDFTDDERIKAINQAKAKKILIFGGINDFLQDLPLGTFGDTSKTASFFGALDYLYKNLRKNNPNAKIYHLTPLHTTFADGGGLIPEFNGQNYLTEYVDAIVRSSKKYNITVIDGNKTGITTGNISELSDDKIHIKEKGHKMVYDLLEKEIR